MKHANHCKYCKREIALEIADDYAALGDPAKIFPYRACNRCADLRERRRNLEERIKRAVSPLIIRRLPEIEAKARQVLEELTKKYTVLVADWVGSSAPRWDVEIVNLVIDKPDHWPAVLQQCWKMHSRK